MMATGYVQQITKWAAVRKAAEPPTWKDWQAVEAQLSLEFPEDFKPLLSELSSGEFGGRFTPRP